MCRNVMSAVSIALLTAGSLAGCSSDPPGGSGIVPAVIDTIADSALKQVTLTPDAAERISLATAEVSAGEGPETVIPYGAVIYDPNGLAWAYTVTGDNIFLREEIEIDRIEGDQAFLTSGPDVGSPIVVVGVAELFGAETGIGK